MNGSRVHLVSGCFRWKWNFRSLEHDRLRVNLLVIVEWADHFI